MFIVILLDKNEKSDPWRYLTELLLGLPDPYHFRSISSEGRRFPSGPVICMTVLVLLGRTRADLS